MPEPIFTKDPGDKTKWCCDCRAGEHANYADDTILVIVKDPDTNRLSKRAYLCSEHIEMYLNDGFRIYYKGRQL